MSLVISKSPAISQVHEWVVKRPSLLKSIHATMVESSKDRFKHSFVAFEDVIRDGWQAEVLCGNYEKKTIAQLLGNLCRISDAQQRWRTLLDLRKGPHKSGSYLPPQSVQSPDRMEIVPYLDTLGLD